MVGVRVLGVKAEGVSSVRKFLHIVLSTTGNKHQGDQTDTMQIVVSIHLLRVVVITPMLMAYATSRLCLNSEAIAPLLYPLKNIL